MFQPWVFANNIFCSNIVLLMAEIILFNSALWATYHSEQQEKLLKFCTVFDVEEQLSVCGNPLRGTWDIAGSWPADQLIFTLHHFYFLKHNNWKSECFLQYIRSGILCGIPRRSRQLGWQRLRDEISLDAWYKKKLNTTPSFLSFCKLLTLTDQ